MTRIYVGTSSWSQHTNFYPEGLPSNRQISFYARHFPIVEINSTFYRIMPQRNFRLWAQRTPEGFIFDVKPYRQLTWHDRKNPPDDEVTETFRESLQPLRDAGKLGAVHFQFPPWFKFQPENVNYIKKVRETFAEDRVGVEFRHRSWLEGNHVRRAMLSAVGVFKATRALLESNGVAHHEPAVLSLKGGIIGLAPAQALLELTLSALRVGERDLGGSQGVATTRTEGTLVTELSAAM